MALKVEIEMRDADEYRVVANGHPLARVMRFSSGQWSLFDHQGRQISDELWSTPAAAANSIFRISE